jgi:mycolipenoyl-CoA---2-(long-chain-fatty acyl)-trehalose mycolipenoyltransferase / long-chain-acyl-CoA---trehalose acyltransferase
MVAFGTIHDWTPASGSVISWQACPRARVKAAQAPGNDVPPSYQQEQHLRAFREHQRRDLDMARLGIGAWDISGVCDIPAMTYAINAHLRRHDTYHSWFEFNDGDDIVRHTIGEPGDIEFAPTNYGEMGPAQIRSHLLDTSRHPLVWDCFTFGIIQRKDHFTVYVSVDHLHTDGMSAGVIFVELHLMYASMLHGAPLTLPDPARYHEHCVRERAFNASLSAESPLVSDWIRFAQRNGGTLPDFPLPLGDKAVPSTGAMIVVPLMDARASEMFELACREIGVRLSGGVLACAALAECALTGAQTYYGITPYDTRSEPAEYMAVGWFASFIPITVDTGDGSFADAARAAQESFDTAQRLAKVPFERVLELAPAELGLSQPERAVPMLSFIDGRKVPVTAQWDDLNAGIYGDSRLSDQVCMWVNRFENETTLTISFPDNAVARESVGRYIDAVRAVYARVSDRAVIS